MTGLNLGIIWLNLVFAGVAGITNLWVARSLPTGFKFVRLAVGLLALFYTLGYVALVFGMVDLAAWSDFFRGISPFAWLLAWILPAIYERRVINVMMAHRTDRDSK